ncbi:MAG: hypothetical protein GDA53_05780 [Rhodobacteraceae bacterium]|nr:hypothetical protein [Paracoccaceae bacterium]
MARVAGPDTGAPGIIRPMIRFRAQVPAGVARYPPYGSRSFGPAFIMVTDYYASASDAVVVCALIGTAEAIETLDGIISMPGPDDICIGPADLSPGSTQGQPPPGPDRQEADMQELIRTVAARILGPGSWGLWFGGRYPLPVQQYAAQAAERRVGRVTVSGDVRRWPRRHRQSGKPVPCRAAGRGLAGRCRLTGPCGQAHKCVSCGRGRRAESRMRMPGRMTEFRNGISR